ncbi:MAG: hypothetical protein CXR31_12685 [Geobacter sp.]|nr:MAG: hypothetical protein CXR31_12685 [Geobacter sp.]
MSTKQELATIQQELKDLKEIRQKIKRLSTPSGCPDSKTLDALFDAYAENRDVYQALTQAVILTITICTESFRESFCKPTKEATNV